MSNLELEVSKRNIKGKKVRFLRRGGLIPGIIYGHGISSIPVQVDIKKLSHLLGKAGGTDLINLKIKNEDSTSRVLIRDIQRNPLTGDPIHVDFYQVKMTEKLRAEVPLIFVGEPPALKLKNVSLLHALTSLHIEALPDDLPHNIEVDISGLEKPEDALHVKDIKINPKISILTDPEQMVIKVTELRKGMEEVPAAAEVGVGEETVAEEEEKKPEEPAATEK